MAEDTLRRYILRFTCPLERCERHILRSPAAGNILDRTFQFAMDRSHTLYPVTVLCFVNFRKQKTLIALTNRVFSKYFSKKSFDVSHCRRI